jgi:pilus assembly protein FimV
MNARMTTLCIRLVALVLLLGLSPALLALGLGDVQLRSYLGQPLDARVALITRSQDELDSVTAGLAKADDYALMGLNRAALSVPLSFEIQGTFPDASVHVTSDVPVNDPVLQLVVEISFAGGRMLREYTLFLDPPTFPSAVPAPVISPRRPSAETEPLRTPTSTDRPAPGTNAGERTTRSEDAPPEPAAAAPVMFSPPESAAEPETELSPEPEDTAAPMQAPARTNLEDAFPPYGAAPSAAEPAEARAAPDSPMAAAAGGEAEPAAQEPASPSASEADAADAGVTTEPAALPADAEEAIDRVAEQVAEPEPFEEGLAEPLAAAVAEPETGLGSVEADAADIDEGRRAEPAPELITELTTERTTEFEPERPEGAAAAQPPEPAASPMDAMEEPAPVTKPERAVAEDALTEESGPQAGETEAAAAAGTVQAPAEAPAATPEEPTPAVGPDRTAASAAEEPATSQPEPEPEPAAPVLVAEPELEPEPEPEPKPEPEPGRMVSATPPSDPAPTVPAAADTPRDPPLEDSGEVYGPVEQGDTLWVIAANFRRGTSYSINQAMLAIQRLNPQAFVGNNINALRSGVMLRMPRLDQLATLSSRAAYQEALRQEQEYRARRAGQPYQRPPVLAAREPAERTTAMDTTPIETSAEPDVPSGRLELVPPEEAGAIAAGPGGADDGAAGAGASGDRTAQVPSEEELASMQQEQAYLQEQIRTLEAQVEAVEPEEGIVDTGLAEMESALREERLSDEPEEPVAVVPPSDSEPWYGGSAWWLVMPAIALIALTIWFLRRLSHGRRTGPDADAGPPGRPEPASGEASRADGDSLAAAAVEGGQPEPPAATIGRQPVMRSPTSRDEEAVELDANDPETKLDLARAYLAMGKPDTARPLLEEILAAGDEEQVRKARDLLADI